MTSNEGSESPFYIGSVYTGVDDARRLALMEAFDARPVRGEDCAGCKYDRICDGGCVANNYMLTGSLGAVPEVYCWWRRELLRQAERIEKGVEKCRTRK